MPGPDGLLTPEERARATNWLNEKTKNYQCPVCSTNNWGIGQHIIQENIYRPNVGLFVGGPVYPMIFTACLNCGYTRHFNAIQVGIVTNDAPSEDASKGAASSPKQTGGGNVG